jgi:hypothetical protein
VVDSILQHWFPLKGITPFGWYVEQNLGSMRRMMLDPPFMHGNLVPIALCTKDENVVYVDKDLEQLHELVMDGKVTKYQRPTLVSPTNR